MRTCISIIRIPGTWPTASASTAASTESRYPPAPADHQQHLSRQCAQRALRIRHRHAHDHRQHLYEQRSVRRLHRPDGDQPLDCEQHRQRQPDQRACFRSTVNADQTWTSTPGFPIVLWSSVTVSDNVRLTITAARSSSSITISGDG